MLSSSTSFLYLRQIRAWRSLFVCSVCGSRDSTTQFRLIPGPKHRDEETVYLDVLCSTCCDLYAPSCLKLVRRQERKLSEPYLSTAGEAY